MLKKLCFPFLLTLWLCLPGGVPGALAFDREDFPIKVYVSPSLQQSDADNSGTPLPQKAYLSIRQAVLDWVRMLGQLPSNPSDATFTIVLKEQMDEQDAERLRQLGVLVFVPKREEADLVIEALDKVNVRSEDNRYNPNTLGYFTNDPHYRVGRIVVGIRQYVYDRKEESSNLDLRTVMLHEIGHALGLEHVRDEKCNLMSASKYTCDLDYPSQCRPMSVRQAVCIAIEDRQLRQVEAQLLAERTAERVAGASKPSETEFDAQMQAYTTSIQTRLAIATASLPASRKGRVLLTLSGSGEVKAATVERSFGETQVDTAVLAEIKKLSPFDRFPASFKEPEVSFTLSLLPEGVIQKYVALIKPAILGELARLERLKQVGQVQLRVTGKGEITEVKTLASFGSPRLDERAMTGIRSLSPLPPISGLDEADAVYVTFSYGFTRAKPDPKP